MIPMHFSRMQRMKMENVFFLNKVCYVWHIERESSRTEERE